MKKYKLGSRVQETHERYDGQGLRSGTVVAVYNQYYAVLIDQECYTDTTDAIELFVETALQHFYE